VAQRGGDRGGKGMGPGATAGSKGALENQIMRIKWGLGKAKSCAPKGPRKVVYGHDPAVFQLYLWPEMIGTRPCLCYRFDPKGKGRDPGKCNKAKLRKIQKIGAYRALRPSKNSWALNAPCALFFPKSLIHQKSLGPRGFLGPQGFVGPRRLWAP
jgi:hypothetical protein